jgi:hypothetical protein
VPAVLDLVEPSVLEHQPPRRLPIFFLPNLIGEYLIERPLRHYLDPLVIAGFVGAIVLVMLQIGPLLWIALISLLVIRIGGGAWHMFRDVYEDYLLMRYGVLVNAHVMGVRTCRNAHGDIAGAYVDCAIPLSQRRTSVGSVWLPDAAQAMQLGSQGRLPVICLARAPGAWRLRNGDGAHLRYQPTGE